MSDKILKYRFICNFSNHQFPVESISGSSQIAFFMNLRTDLNDQGWWTGSMWSLPPDRFHAGWSVTHFRASCIHSYNYVRAWRTDKRIVEFTKITKNIWTSTNSNIWYAQKYTEKSTKTNRKRVNTWGSSPRIQPIESFYFYFFSLHKPHPLMIGDVIWYKGHWHNSHISQSIYYKLSIPTLTKSECNWKSIDTLISTLKQLKRMKL